LTCTAALPGKTAIASTAATQTVIMARLDFIGDSSNVLGGLVGLWSVLQRTAGAMAGSNFEC
jgi:hypothetical protein